MGVVPAAFAFFAVAGFGGNGKFITYFHFCFRHQQSKAQFFAQSIQIVGNFFRSRNFGFGLQGRTDGFVGAQRLDGGGYRFAGFADCRPFLHQFGFGFFVDGRELVPSMEEDAVFFAAADDVPCFFAGKAQNRCNQENQTARDVVQGGLRAATGAAVGFGGVETVFQDVEVERAQVFRAERNDVFHGEVEGVARIVIACQTLLQLTCQYHGVAVNFHHVCLLYGIFNRIEVAQVGKQEAQGIADTAVTFGYAFEDFFGNRQFAAVIGGCRPQAQDVGAELVIDFLRRDDVADGFRHFAAVLVNHETVGQKLFVRGAAH